MTDMEKPQFAARATAALLDDRAGQPALVCVDSLVKHLEYAPPAYTKDYELKTKSERNFVEGRQSQWPREQHRQDHRIDHIAFEIDRADFDAERKRLEQMGQAIEIAEHAWVHWRSLYVTDPEGNTVELVCYDPTVV
jgi:catechol 2,3-dioxygenase-like lactoylglutathione lyase family enzyme